MNLLLEKIWIKLRNHMEGKSITGFVDSCTSLSKIAMFFNISPCASLDTRMPQQKLLYLLSDMGWNILCTIHMNPEFTKEIKFTKLMKAHTNVTSKQGMHKSIKTRNTTTSSTHILMHNMPEIYLTDNQSHQQFISSMLNSYNGAPGKIWDL